MVICSVLLFGTEKQSQISGLCHVALQRLAQIILHAACVGLGKYLNLMSLVTKIYNTPFFLVQLCHKFVCLFFFLLQCSIDFLYFCTFEMNTTPGCTRLLSYYGESGVISCDIYSPFTKQHKVLVT